MMNLVTRALLTTVIVGLLNTSAALGQLLLSENFDYPATSTSLLYGSIH